MVYVSCPMSRLQLYVRGELMGGLDIVKDMKSSGSLASQLGVATKVLSTY